MQDNKPIAFIGLGNMGLPMATNLLTAGHAVRGFDMASAACDAARAAGVEVADSIASAVSDAGTVVSALPAAKHVRAAYLGLDGIIANAPSGTLLIDCSTIDVGTARDVIQAAEDAQQLMVDSPMSGGVPGATAGTLTFMVGGTDVAFERASPLLEIMGKNIFHAGGPGSGCAAKICNNMLLGISMIGVSEAFNLAEQLGLSAETLYKISSTATGRCWSLNDYCPAPGPVPTAPSSRDYKAGFAGELMLKDLRLAMDVAREAEVATPLGAQAAQVYGMMDLAGMNDLDFSAVIRFLAGRGRPDVEAAED